MMRPVHTTITGRFDKITASLLVLLIFSQLYIWKQSRSQVSDLYQELHPVGTLRERSPADKWCTAPKSSSPFLTKNSGAKELLVGALCQIMALIMTFLGAVPWKNEIWAVVVVTAPTTLAIYAHFVMIRGLTGRPHVTGFVQYHDVPGLGAEKEEPTRREVV